MRARGGAMRTTSVARSGCSMIEVGVHEQRQRLAAHRVGHGLAQHRRRVGRLVLDEERARPQIEQLLGRLRRRRQLLRALDALLGALPVAEQEVRARRVHQRLEVDVVVAGDERVELVARRHRVAVVERHQRQLAPRRRVGGVGRQQRASDPRARPSNWPAS